jgi:hypothetical protein
MEAKSKVRYTRLYTLRNRSPSLLAKNVNVPNLELFRQEKLRIDRASRCSLKCFLSSFSVVCGGIFRMKTSMTGNVRPKETNTLLKGWFRSEFPRIKAVGKRQGMLASCPQLLLASNHVIL